MRRAGAPPLPNRHGASRLSDWSVGPHAPRKARAKEALPSSPLGLDAGASLRGPRDRQPRSGFQRLRAFSRFREGGFAGLFRTGVLQQKNCCSIVAGCKPLSRSSCKNGNFPSTEFAKYNQWFLAEEVGFEPTVGLHPRRFSRPVP